MNHWTKIPAKQTENSQTKEIFCKHRISGGKIQLIVHLLVIILIQLFLHHY